MQGPVGSLAALVRWLPTPAFLAESFTITVSPCMACSGGCPAAAIVRHTTTIPPVYLLLYM